MIDISNNNGINVIEILETSNYSFKFGFKFIESDDTLDSRFNGVIRISNDPSSNAKAENAPKPIPFQNFKTIRCYGNSRGQRDSFESNPYIHTNDDNAYWADIAEAQLVFTGNEDSYDTSGSFQSYWGLGYFIEYRSRNGKGMPDANFFTMEFTAYIEARTIICIQHANNLGGNSDDKKPLISGSVFIEKLATQG